jgi:hypothetical protein
MPLFRTACLFIFLVLVAGGLFAEANTTKISAAEYFVDTDPGEGNATALTAQDGAFDSEVEAIVPVDLNATGLSVGPHLIGIRYKDDNNTWGDVLYQTIHVYDANPSGSGSGGSDGGESGGSSVGFATITGAEYFVDTDPGEGNGTAFQPQDGAFDSEVESILPKDLNVTGLSVGPHLVGVRYKDNSNIWGDVLYQTIHLYDANPSLEQNVTTRLEAEDSSVASTNTNEGIKNLNGDTYIDLGPNGSKITFQGTAQIDANHTLKFSIKSSSGLRKMGIYVNGVKKGVCSASNSSFQDFRWICHHQRSGIFCRHRSREKETAPLFRLRTGRLIQRWNPSCPRI